VTVGRHSELKEKLAKRARKYDGRLHLLGWTNQMPELMMRSHLVIGKAGGATVQEAIAARCPLIINQVIPGQEEATRAWSNHWEWELWRRKAGKSRAGCGGRWRRMASFGANGGSGSRK